MSIEDESFFEENIININHKVSRYLVAMNLVPVLLFILTKAGIFEIPDYQSFAILSYTVLVTVIDKILIRQKSSSPHLVAMYFGLLAVEGFVGIMGTSRNIGIYITFGLVPALSCLYYNRKLTNIINIIGYFTMLISLVFKRLNNGAIFEIDTHPGFLESYIPVIAGLTIEFTFTVLATNFIAVRNYNALRKIITSVKEKNKTLLILRKKNKELHETQFKIIKFVSGCLGSHDLFTGTHVVHTQIYVKIIAEKLRASGFYTDILTEENIKLYQNAAFLHDIGKLHIPEGILNKIGRFTDEERKLMNSHPAEGKKLLEELPVIEKGKFNTIAIQMAYCHHEKWDGTGYPQGLKGNDIPLCARIMAAADVMDALISQRLYKEPMDIDQAMKVFKESSGTHFEPCIAEATIQCRDLIEIEDKKFKELELEKYKEELDWWKSYHDNFTKM